MKRRERLIKDYDVHFILAAQQFIDENPKKQLTITALALEVGINPYKLKRGFKQVFKTTIHQYRLGVRLNLAKQLLEETDLTVEEIARKVGFTNRNGFAFAFKREFSWPPRKWRYDQAEITEYEMNPSAIGTSLKG